MVVVKMHRLELPKLQKNACSRIKTSALNSAKGYSARLVANEVMKNLESVNQEQFEKGKTEKSREKN